MTHETAQEQWKDNTKPCTCICPGFAVATQGGGALVGHLGEEMDRALPVSETSRVGVRPQGTYILHEKENTP